ncbi:hypothetical protein [Erythrobacter ani]|uniref:Uncharacterized protein n=1 Tax=Erythrobacter ani TaxID=2827235 RepID=A0ABS6SML6_9SPHN|nr:hypothetical protein [Erythrobacter ani]MBV7266251.1 hypothetical protein [Erythrobacter ani]
MSVVQTVVAGQEWEFNPEPRQHNSANWQVIAFAQAIDEQTGLPPRQRALFTQHPARFGSTASAGGLVGLTGQPQMLFSDPWPVPSPDIEFSFAVPGFLPVTLAGGLPAQPGFPGTFAPLDFGTIGLHRTPTSLEGVLVDAIGNTVAGANVAVTRGWRRIDDLSGPGQPVSGVTLSRPLAVDRPAGAGVRVLPIAPAAPTKMLVRAISPGARQITLSDRAGLNVGDPLILGADSERREYPTIQSIDTSYSADQPAKIALEYPIAGSYLANSDVTPASYGAAGPVNLIDFAARTSDTSLLLDGLNGFGVLPGQLQISSPGIPDEHHDWTPWTTLSGAEGEWRLPAVHRLAHIELSASGGGQPTPTLQTVTLNGLPSASVTLVFE